MIVALAVLTVPLPARGAVAPAHHAPNARTAAILTRLAPVRRALDSPGVAAAVRAAMHLERIEPAALPREGTGDPRGVGGALTALLAAMDRASAAASRAITGDLRVLGRAAERFHPAGVGRGPQGPVPLPGASPRGARAFIELLDRTVDRSLLHSAALHVATAVDTALPALAPSGPARARHDALTTCDVLEIGTRVCVGGTGSNTYTEDYDLLIDQGGDDVYANAPGAADPLVNRIPVAVAIDLGGNDRYATTLPREGSFVAQGSGERGGIGLLVDVAGDDTYEAIVEQQPTATPGRRVCAMGCGITGVGVLADLAGDDRYTHANVGPSALGTGVLLGSSYLEFEEANGLGVGYEGGLGVLTDRGGSNDSYLELGNPVPVETDEGLLHGGQTLVNGFGFAQTGAAALFADDGGTDSMVSRAIVDPHADLGLGQSRGMGQGWNGVGAAIAGPGDTQWVLSSENVRSAEGLVPSQELNGGAFQITIANTAEGQGEGTTGGFGALFDAGGDDSYRAEANVDIRYQGVNDGAESALVKAAAGPAFAWGQGFGSTGTGALIDWGGDDSRVLRATSRTATSATDREPASPMPSATADSGIVYVWGQGSGNGIAPVGVLLDREGDDLYRAEGLSRATAQATPFSEGDPAEGNATSGVMWNYVQGTGFGTGTTGRVMLLQDLGGTDGYFSSAASTAEATPPTKVTLPHPTQLASYSQCVGPGPGLFLDSDEGAPDTFTSLPPQSAQSGTRGEGIWMTGNCVGVNR